MTGDFDNVFLDCGHAPNAYIGFGVCKKCGMTACSRCLTSWNGDLLCARCFVKAMGE